MSTINDVYKAVTNVVNSLKTLPQRLLGAMKKDAAAVVATVAPVLKVVATFRQPFNYAAAIIQYVAKESAAVKGEGDKIRGQLTTFFRGLGNCVTQTNTLTRSVSTNIPPVGAVSSFVGDLIANVLNRIPDIALLPVAKALADRPGWETKPDEVTQIITLLIPKTGSKSPADQKEVDVWFVEVLTMLKMINGVLALIIRLLPRDLNAGLAVVGEGGELTLTGHPVSWVFVLGSTLIDEVSTVLSGAQQLIKLNR